MKKRRSKKVAEDEKKNEVSVSLQVVVKLADFGMARRVMDDEYRAESSEKTATRWSPPEVLRDGLYSTSADIWSFGVLMWEVFCAGEKPFSSLSKQEVIERVKGHRGNVVTLDRDSRTFSPEVSFSAVNIMELCTVVIF